MNISMPTTTRCSPSGGRQDLRSFHNGHNHEVRRHLPRRRDLPPPSVHRPPPGRPSDEYRDLTAAEWDEFLAHFELRKVALGTCGRDLRTPCQHENACVRCPLLRVDPAQMPRLDEIHANLGDRLEEAKLQGWLGEVAAIETTLAAADQKLVTMRTQMAQRIQPIWACQALLQPWDDRA